MTLRARIAVTAAAAVALAFMITAAGLYAATARTLLGEVDRSLTRIADDLSSGRPGRVVRSLSGAREGFLGGPGGFVQLVDSRGRVIGPRADQPRLPHDAAVAAVAAGEREPYYTTIDVAGRPARVLTVPVAGDMAAQVARPLGEIEASLAALRNRLALGGIVAIVLAAGLGMLVARGAVRPVRNLTALAEQVAATGDLTRRIGIDGNPGAQATDELHRLARTFNAMLANLEQARVAQQQLVADASHELRTPLTSLRTNIEVLALDAGASANDATALSAVDRRRLLDDLTVQLGEFGRLVRDLIELARGAQPARTLSSVAVDELVEAAADRARAFAGPGQRIDVDAEPVTVEAEAERLDRAVANLLDNAVKYGGGAPIHVSVNHAGGSAQIAVRDHGPGIDPAQLPRVFERFYRAPGVSDVPGSGLGLAIVRQVAEAHGGRVDATAAPDGGLVVTLRLPLRRSDA